MLFDQVLMQPRHGELTNPASIAAEGLIGGNPYCAVRNFGKHAEGYRRVSVIIINEE